MLAGDHRSLRLGDGHRFFAERRVLRYLREPKVDQALDRADRAALERVCSRLPELVPAEPPVLTHGDLWHANLIAGDAGEPVFIDPAVSWMWAEVDLSMMFCTGRASSSAGSAKFSPGSPDPGRAADPATGRMLRVVAN